MRAERLITDDGGIDVFSRLLKTAIQGIRDMRPKISTLVIVAIAIAGGSAFAVTRKTAAPAAPAVQPPVSVVAGTVTSQDVPIYLRGIGTVIAYMSSAARSRGS